MTAFIKYKAYYMIMYMLGAKSRQGTTRAVNCHELVPSIYSVVPQYNSIYGEGQQWKQNMP